MTSIMVRRPDFQWPDDLPLLPVPDDPSRSCEFLALSFTLPYLEPYLIRTMRVAAKQVDDPVLRADMKAFSGQEAQHFQNHARVNDIVRNQLNARTATAMRKLEDQLDADYRRFSDTKSLAFNLAYAEGFEAMTFALARSVMTMSEASNADPAWANLIAWHLAEEVEHRTVTFDAYQAVVGRYPHRVAVGSWAQIHFLRYLLRMATVLQQQVVGPHTATRQVLRQALERNWRTGLIPNTLHALRPSYNPRNVELSDDMRLLAETQGVVLA